MEAGSAHVARPQMIQDAWVRDEDDWSGISDPKARRRIQNRRNQRKLRRKIRMWKDCPLTEDPMVLPVLPTTVTSSRHGQVGFDILNFEDVAHAIRSVNVLELQSSRNQAIMQRFEAFAFQCYAVHAPVISFRPTLSQYNFIRALWTNVNVLSLSTEQMSDDDALSPFNSGCSTDLECRLPTALKPTELQRKTLHHPWIDLIPIPGMRDNIFRRGFDFFDEENLCHDMRGRVDQDPGVLVWGDPWDCNSWEVTEHFVRTWGWTIIGCHALLRSTNDWRVRRGERPLFRLPSPAS